MKIGILTYHRSHNYGAMLQAYATRKLFEEKGCDVYYLDYWPEHQKKIYKIIDNDILSHFSWKGKFYYLWINRNIIIAKIIRKYRFNQFYWTYISPFVRSTKEQYDIILYGSDQIWRKQPFDHQYNAVYFGKNFFKSSCHYAFSASMGNVPDNDQDTQVVKEYLAHLDKISVRETKLLNFIKTLGYADASLVLDPTLILDSSIWKLAAGDYPLIKKGGYILLYDLLIGSFEQQYVEKYAQQRGLKIISLVGTADSFPTHEYRTTDGPIEFLNLVRYSTMVLTSSFHCLVFSIIFNTPFYCSFCRNSDRAFSLLAELGLSDFMLPSGSSIPPEKKNYKWKEVNSKIYELREPSLSFIDDILK